MKDRHIISILESAPLANLDAGELAMIRAHVADCAACRKAFDAAQISSLLIKERAAQEIEPSPFFQTRVLAAWRERQASSETAASVFVRLWKATGALVSGMAATVAVLAVLTFTAPHLDSTQPDMASTPNVYAAEDLMLAQSDAAEDELSYEQVFAAIYDADVDAGR